MRRSHRAPLVVIALLSCAVATVAADLDETTKAAVTSAEDWLELADDGDYAESWQTAADYFKKAVTEEQWRQAMEAVRTPLGAVVTRTLKSTQHATQLPGAPDGTYVVIQYDTSFEHKKSAVETVTPMQQADGSWRVSGYFIR